MSQPRRDRSNPKPRRGAPKRGRRPFIDILEERAVPATFTVTTTDDSGAGSLRAAIALAAANEEADTIDFAPSLAGQKIALTSNSANTAFGPTALTIVDDDVTIDGAAARLLEIGGNDERRIFAVGAGAKLTLQNITLTDGLAQGGRGGDSAGGAATGGGGAGMGGAVYVYQGTLVVRNSTLYGNSAVGGRGGDAPATANSTAATGGGAVGGDGGDNPGGNSLTGGGGVGGSGGNGVGGANESGQQAAGAGAAGTAGGGGAGGSMGYPGVEGGSGAALSSGGFGGGGGAGNTSADDMMGDTYNTPGGGDGGFGGGGGGSSMGIGGDGGFGGGGGGAYNGPGGQGGFGGGSGSSNAGYSNPGGGGAGLGGAVFNNEGTALIENSTFTSNVAVGGAAGIGGNATAGQGYGGAIFNRNGDLTVVSSTIAGNTGAEGPGIVNLGDGAGKVATAHVDDSILGTSGWDYQFRGDVNNDGGTNTSTGTHNLVSYTNGFNAQNTIFGDTKLTALADNGGPTMTMAPAADSPAIDAGDTAGNALSTDQRGKARVYNGALDIGALEVQPDASPPDVVAPGFLYFAQGSTRSYTITLTGSPTPVLDSHGSLPPGLTLVDNGDGTLTLSGTPTTNNGGVSVPLVIEVRSDYEGGTYSDETLYLFLLPELTLTTPLAPTEGAAYSFQLVADGGNGENAYQYAAVGLPDGLSMDANGLITGTPTAPAGTAYTTTVTITDLVGNVRTYSYDMTVRSAITIAPGSLPELFAPDEYSVQFSATGPVEGDEFTFFSLDLPAGMELSSDGVLSGTPTDFSGSPFTFTVTARDEHGNQGDATFVLIAHAPVSLADATPPRPAVGSVYSFQLVGTGGSGSGYTFAAASLPAGLSMTADGLITGTPTAALGATDFAIVVTDGQGRAATVQVEFLVHGAIALDPAPLPGGTALTAYSGGVSATGGAGGFTYAAAGLPTGLSIDPATGLITGVPAGAVGSPFTVTITATDSEGASASFEVQLAVAPALGVTVATLPSGSVGDAYSHQLVGEGGSGSGYTFSATDLPDGLSISPDGLITGTVGLTSYTPLLFQTQVTITDGEGASRTVTVPITIYDALAFDEGPIHEPAIGSPYSHQMVVTGGSGSGYTFSATGLPDGLSMSEAGLITGTATGPAGLPATVTVTVHDGGSTATYTFGMMVNPALVFDVDVQPPTATAGVAYSHQIEVAGGSGEYTFTAADLPPGLSIDPGTGLITGTPTDATGSPYTFTVTATDWQGAEKSQEFTLAVRPALGVTAAALPGASNGNPYTYQLVGEGGSGSGYTYSATGLPEGLGITPEGLVLGTPNIPSYPTPFDVTVTITDGDGASREVVVSLVVYKGLAFDESPLPAPAVGAAYSHQIEVTGGTGDRTFSATGLPDGLSISEAGLITGTPTDASGSPYMVWVTVHDGGSMEVHGYSLAVNPAIVVGATPLAPATAGSAYSGQVSVSGGSGSGYTFAATGLPAGLSIDPDTGAITGTPADASGSPYAVTVTVTDGEGSSKSQEIALTVRQAIGLVVTTIPGVAEGSAYSYQLVGSGGSGSGYTFDDEDPPAGLSMLGLTLGADGLITGTASNPYPHLGYPLPLMLPIRVTDGDGATGTTYIYITLNQPLVVGGGLLAPAVGSEYSNLLSAAGGSGSGYTFTATGLPAGLSISEAGLITGTPTAQGSSLTFDVTVTDSEGSSKTVTYTMTINPEIVIDAATAPRPELGEAYSYQVGVAGGSGEDYVFTATGLPPGLSISPDGLITGTPTTVVGSPFTATITVMDGQGAARSVELSLTVRGPLAIGEVMPSPAAGSEYSQQVPVGGGSGSGYEFTATGLPDGLSISEAGLITGTPTTPGTYTIEVTVVDDEENTATATITLVVNPEITFVDERLPSPAVGSVYSHQVGVEGGSGEDFTFTAVGLPTGLSIDPATGIITGTIVSPVGTIFGVTITATDGEGASRSVTYTLAVNPAVVIATTTPAEAAEGSAYSHQVEVEGGSGSGYTFTATGLPPGLSIDPATGLITGTVASGIGSPFTVYVTATDGEGASVTTPLTLVVNPPVVIDPAPLPQPAVGSAYEHQLATAGGSGGGYTYAATGLPAGLSISPTGLITGTVADATGSPFTVEVTVTDGQGASVTTTLTLVVNPAISIDPTSIPQPAVGSPYNHQVEVEGGSGSGYTFTAEGLPPGLSIDPATGIISGLVTDGTGSPFTVTVTATDGEGATHALVVTMVVNPPVVIDPAPLPQPAVGSAYEHQLATAGGSGGGYTYAATGLPAGLSISPTGLITGTVADATGSPFTVEVTVTDGQGASVTTTLTLVVNPPLEVSPSTLPPTAVGSGFQPGLATTGGSGSGYTYAAVGLPAGLTMNPDGSISGRITAPAGTYIATVTATDGQGASVSVPYSIEVLSAIVPTEPSFPSPVVGVPYSHQVEAEGGSGSGYTYAAVGLPAGLAIDPTTGVISGTIAGGEGGTYAVVVTITDGNGATGTHELSFVVAPPLRSNLGELPAPVAGRPYSQQLVGSGGSGSGYTFTATGLPPGLSISPDGLITGTPTTAAGSPYTVTVAITDGDGATTTRTYQFAVSRATPTIGLTSSSTSSEPGAALTFTASVSAAGAAAAPQGYVAFYDGEALMGWAWVVDGVATYTTSSLPAGPHTIRAVYSGDDVFGLVVSQAVEQSVLFASTGSVVPPATAPGFGGTAPFTLAVPSQGGRTATGRVAFYDGDVLLGIAHLDANGVATFAATGLSVGVHSIRAIYEGDAHFRAFATSPVTTEVVRNASTMGVVTSSSPTVYVGQSLTLTATLTAVSNSPVPLTGRAAFYDETGALLGVAWVTPGPAALSSETLTTVVGHATLTGVSLSPGTHTIRVVYEGDANYAPVESTTQATVLVQPVATSTTLGVSATPAGTTVLTATVAAVDPSAPAPSGTVRFYDGDALLAEIPLVNGVATYDVGALAAGAHAFRAVFASADGSTGGGSSGSATVSTTGPQVVGLSRYGVRWSPTKLVLTFDSSLDPASAVRASNYRIVGPNGRPVAVSRAVYDPAANAVTLYPARRLNLARTYVLTVNGQLPDGVAGVTGVPLDGSGLGRPGTDFRAAVGHRALANPGDPPAVKFSKGTASAARSGYLAHIRAVLGRGGRFADLAALNRR